MRDSTDTFQCPVCGLHYHDQVSAEACEAFCTEHSACSLEITKLTVESEQKES